MKKKTVWTIELPSNTDNRSLIRSAIYASGGKIVSVKEEFAPLTDEECYFWYERWMSFPDTTFYTSNQRHKIIYSVTCLEGKLKVGVAKCRNEDAFNFNFGCALAEARCLGDRKLERALLRFTPEQIDKFF